MEIFILSMILFTLSGILEQLKIANMNEEERQEFKERKIQSRPFKIAISILSVIFITIYIIIIYRNL